MNRLEAHKVFGFHSMMTRSPCCYRGLSSTLYDIQSLCLRTLRQYEQALAMSKPRSSSPEASSPAASGGAKSRQHEALLVQQPATAQLPGDDDAWSSPQNQTVQDLSRLCNVRPCELQLDPAGSSVLYSGPRNLSESSQVQGNLTQPKILSFCTRQRPLPSACCCSI